MSTHSGPPSTGATITILLLLFNTTRAHTPDSQAHRSHYQTLDGGRILLLLFNTTRTLSGPPSTGVANAIAMTNVQ